MAVRIPTKLKKIFKPQSGGHTGYEKEACIMEFVNLLSPNFEVWGTDAACVDDKLTSIAISINDAVGDTQRDRLTKFAPRFLETDYKKNHKQMKKDAYEWAQAAIKRHKPDVGYYSSAPMAVKKSQFSSWLKASTTCESMWTGLFKKFGEDDKALMDEAVRFFNAVLPEGPECKPNWQRARIYFETGVVPEHIGNADKVTA